MNISENTLYNILKSINKKYLSSKDILEATKIDETDKVCFCFVKSRTMGNVVYNPIWVYVDAQYSDEQRFLEDINNDCRTICDYLGYQFISILNYRILD